MYSVMTPSPPKNKNVLYFRFQYIFLIACDETFFVDYTGLKHLKERIIGGFYLTQQQRTYFSSLEVSWQ